MRVRFLKYIALLAFVASAPAQMEFEAKWLWSFPVLSGSIHSAPAIADDGTIYVGCQSGRLYALHPHGAQKWEFIADKGTTADEILSCTVAADGNIFVGSLNERLYSISPAGKKNWESLVGAGNWWAPVVGKNGIIYYATVSSLRAFKSDGSIQWTHTWDNSSGAVNSPTLGPDDAIYVPTRKGIFVFNSDGTVRWRTMEPIFGASPVTLDTSHDRVYCETSAVGFSAKIRALKASSGALVWEYGLGSFDKGIVPLPAPVLGPNDTLYVSALYAAVGKLFSLDKETGNPKWQVQIKARPSSPVVSENGTIFVGCRGKFLAFQPDGMVKWAYNLGSTTDVGGDPTIRADGSVIFGAGGDLTALGTDGGALAATPWPKVQQNLKNSGRAVREMPVVRLTAPTDGQTFDFYAPGNIALTADVSSADSTIQKVEFFSDSVSLGSSTQVPFGVQWSDGPKGNHVLQAVATDALGVSVKSTPVNIKVVYHYEPIIKTQPSDVMAYYGTQATFSVAVTGPDPMSFQWMKNGKIIPDATSDVYITPKTEMADDKAVYAVTVKNEYGSVTSREVHLSVNGKPMIASDPISRTVVLGDPVSFSVEATGPSLTYQWRRNGENISGANSSTYQVSSVVREDSNASFSVIVNNPHGNVTSADAVVTVKFPPEIISQPLPQTVSEGESATFSVAAMADSTLKYQWFKNGARINKAVYPTYTTSALNLNDDGGLFTVIVTGRQKVVSSGAALTVTPSGNDGETEDVVD